MAAAIEPIDQAIARIRASDGEPTSVRLAESRRGATFIIDLPAEETA